ncbi:MULTISPECIES: hypothetical protein [unclassified Nocardiopsis]|nr:MULTISPECIES: hypothetical protein [unclassified Nocardiopsis]
MPLCLADKSAYGMVRRCQRARDAPHSLIAASGSMWVVPAGTR